MEEGVSEEKKTCDNARMEIKQLSDFKDVEEIYHSRMREDFPFNELHPLFVMRKLWDAGSYLCLGLYDGPELLGYAFFVRLQDDEKLFYLFDYLAISKDHRDEGLGSFFLKHLPSHIPSPACVIVEIEDPRKAKDEETREIRNRRSLFYERNGYLMTEVTSRVYGADYRLLEIPVGPKHSSEEIQSIYTRLYAHISPKWFLKNHFRVQVDSQGF